VAQELNYFWPLKKMGSMGYRDWHKPEMKEFFRRLLDEEQEWRPVQ